MLITGTIKWSARTAARRIPIATILRTSSVFSPRHATPIPLTPSLALDILHSRRHLSSTSCKMSFPPSNVQGIIAPNGVAATFLTLLVKDASKAKGVVASVPDLTKNVAVRDAQSELNVTVGIGSNVWDEITGLPRPKELHPFKEVRGAKYTAPSTPGDLFFQVRANRRDLIFEFERQLLNKFGTSVETVDEVNGFRNFDRRSLLGFVDGTADPVGADLPADTLVTEADDKNGAGGSYLLIQKYLHDLKDWGKLKVEDQENVIGRTLLNNEELPDAVGDAQKSHKTITTLVKDGVEYDILRDNTQFGRPGYGEFGTFFIGYSRRLWVTEQMLENMYVGVPAGKYDRILDYSKAVTGNVYFVPSAATLESLG